jgi:hypothetical protein
MTAKWEKWNAEEKAILALPKEKRDEALARTECSRLVNTLDAPSRDAPMACTASSASADKFSEKRPIVANYPAS